jgi:ABC-2 type transport system ATP-binding protein
VRGKIIVYSSHVMDMVEKVSTRVLIVHRSRVVADNSVSALRDLLSLPSLEAVFAELTVDEDVSVTADQLVAAMQA